VSEDFRLTGGVDNKMYHAGMSLANRKAAYRMIVYEGVQVIVATIAFSMGIEKPNVRNVIHRGPPQDKDSYYQEIGRLQVVFLHDGLKHPQVLPQPGDR